LTWRIVYSKLAEKQLDGLPRETALRIRKFMEERVAGMQMPRVLAVKLSGAYEDRFRYRVGDYRVICAIEDRTLIILVVQVAHRREVYR